MKKNREESIEDTMSEQVRGHLLMDGNPSLLPIPRSF